MARTKVPEGQKRDSLEYWGGIRPLVRSLGRPREIMEHRSGIANELLAVSFASLDDVMEWDEEGKVKIKASRNIPKHVLKAIKKVKVTSVTDRDGNTTQTLELEMWDKISALRVLARATGLLDKPEDEGDKPSVIGINLMGGSEPVTTYESVDDEPGSEDKDL
jgi:hypothetical protein